MKPRRHMEQESIPIPIPIPTPTMIGLIGLIGLIGNHCLEATPEGACHFG
ncbi:MAG: hypothetical protein PHF14_10510 [Verrucomicrobiota bacterium]|nr:hypothetical protein [Verrucomicrobiota bacterium]